MIDLHCHVLYGVDDGAQSLEESVQMCRLAAADGCEAMIVTPHQRTISWENRDRALLAARLVEVQQAAGPTPRLHLGGEIRVDDELLAELADPAAHGLNPLAGSHYLLLELARDGSGGDPADLVHEVQVAGWRPILAHPEFIAPLAAEPELVGALVELGALVQVTAMSVTGEFGRHPREVVRRLIDAGHAHFVASDAHTPAWRPPGLGKAFREIASRWSEQLARRLTIDNPRAVLEDRPLAP